MIRDSREVARLWGQHTGRPNMTYSTMGRALRHCYSKGTLTKIKQKRCGYQFSEEFVQGMKLYTESDPCPEELPWQRMTPEELPRQRMTTPYQNDGFVASPLYHGNLCANQGSEFTNFAWQTNMASYMVAQAERGWCLTSYQGFPPNTYSGETSVLY